MSRIWHIVENLPPKPQRASKLYWPLVAVAVLLSGCQSNQLPLPPSQAPLPQTPIATGNISGDAFMQQAASATGNRATDLYLRAAQAYLADRDWNGLRAALASTEDANQRADLFLRYAYLNAALALIDNKPGDAEQWLRSRDPALAELGGRDPDQADTAVLQAAVCARSELWECAANSLMSLQDPQAFAASPWFQADTPARLPLEPERADALALNEQIWHYICLTPASIADRQRLLGGQRQQGWWALRNAAAGGQSLTEQRRAIEQWQQGYRAHGAQFPWPGALGAVLMPQEPVQTVALMLPLSGPLSAAGNAVRNGFIAAQLSDQMRLRAVFLDTAAEPLPSLYERALEQGAQVVLGPLSKTNVETLQSLNPQIPVLALNYLTEGTPVAANVLQLGLAIEDEADTLARRLMTEDLTRVLILHSEQDWSRRAATRLQQRLGSDATIESFTDAKTVTEAVGRGMFVEESHLRSQQIFQRIGTHIEFVPRARRDLQAVVALVNNTEANVLVPALRFHFGDYLPVYATGQVTRGAKADDLASLSGFQITEMPWFINGDPLATEVTEAFRLTGNSLASLYALGSDAHRIADRLPLLTQHRDLNFSGGSGALSVSPEGRFSRELAWGTIAQRRVLATPRVSIR